MAVGAPAVIVVSDNGLTSPSMSVPTSAFGPAFFLLGGKYGAAIHSDGKIVGPTTLVANNSTPAKPGGDHCALCDWPGQYHAGSGEREDR